MPARMVRGGSAARREASERGHLVLLKFKLLQETPMTMALSSRLTRVRASPARRSVSLPI